MLSFREAPAIRSEEFNSAFEETFSLDFLLKSFTQSVKNLRENGDGMEGGRREKDKDNFLLSYFNLDVQGPEFSRVHTFIHSHDRT